jgi:hypothetical protein
MTKQLGNLLQKEMTRKEFMATMGLGVASIMGFSTIVQVLTGKSLPGLAQQSLGDSQAGRSGYGSSAYGGHRVVPEPFNG